mmetsp:Transcript_18154/g.61758  ORF Transcript_18154/g.61758 Transcript_18154/m.61758 type:complete len:350 (+) Transcript_18154:453-1502(+)
MENQTRYHPTANFRIANYLKSEAKSRKRCYLRNKTFNLRTFVVTTQLALLFFIICGITPGADAARRGRGNSGAPPLEEAAAGAAALTAQSTPAQFLESLKLKAEMVKLSTAGINRILDEKTGPGAYDGTSSNWDAYSASILLVATEICEGVEVILDESYNVSIFISVMISIFTHTLKGSAHNILERILSQTAATVNRAFLIFQQLKDDSRAEAGVINDERNSTITSTFVEAEDEDPKIALGTIEKAFREYNKGKTDADKLPEAYLLQSMKNSLKPIIYSQFRLSCNNLPNLTAAKLTTEAAEVYETFMKDKRQQKIALAAEGKPGKAPGNDKTNNNYCNFCACSKGQKC